MTGKLTVQLSNTAPMPLQVQFDCAPGELVALVGPSGSGKTSVLRAIAGLLKTPSLQGSITVGDTFWFNKSTGGATATHLSPQERRVGLVFQNYALFPHLSAIENVAISVINTTDNSDFYAKNNEITRIFERLGLGGLKHRLPSELSGGQQQRVALARALARKPAVLLLDEPFSAVDAPTRTQLYRELANLRHSVSTPMVLVTHDLHEARRLADRVVILDAGTTLQSGTPEQVFSRPRNARVAELVGIQNHFKGQFYKAKGSESSTTSSWGRLDWHGCPLHVVDKNKLEDGAHVTWVLATEQLDISPATMDTSHDTSNIATGGKSCAQNLPTNNLLCRFLEILSLGETSICTLAPQAWAGLADARLTLTLSSAHVRHLLQRKEAAENAPTNDNGLVNVHIPPQSIHIMPMRV